MNENFNKNINMKLGLYDTKIAIIVTIWFVNFRFEESCVKIPQVVSNVISVRLK